MPEPVATIKSPCVAVCALNEEDICFGCYRTVKEITGWMAMNDDERRRVLMLSRERSKKNNPFAL